MRKSILLGLSVLIVIPLYCSAWATTDLSTLGSPYVTITPSSGPPGTMITITVSHLPDISKETYPYPDLYIYLPFSKPFGATVQSHCEGEDCFPIYTYDDALKQNFENRTITFTLFSTNNPNPIFLNGYENSICDVILNGKIIQRYSTLCNTKDEPTGTYQIRFVWLLETNLEQRYTAKTVQFTVTPGSPSIPPPVAENGNIVIKEYQSGVINGAEFENKLRALGWNDEQIRQALAIIGKLPHQTGGSGPDHTSNVLQQVNISQNNIEKPSSGMIENNTRSSESTTVQTHTIVNDAEQNSLSYTPQQIISQPIPSHSSTWNNVAITIAIGTAGVVGSIIFVMKKTRKDIQ
ncbi:MAG TPA: hypothetical protein VEU72_02265 [Nitrosopumilaceae archaeon]|nr:hypothetical protein [Nitrosopumilaceae archaeon]